MDEETYKEILKECKPFLNSIKKYKQYDEILTECKTPNVKEALRAFKTIMATGPNWADGLPLGAECISSK